MGRATRKKVEGLANRRGVNVTRKLEGSRITIDLRVLFPEDVDPTSVDKELKLAWTELKNGLKAKLK